MRSKKIIRSRASEGISRREVMRNLVVGAGAIGGSALLPQAALAAAPSATAEVNAEEHESIQRVSSFEKTARGAVFHCTTSGGRKVDVNVTVCTPEIIRVQMCPDPQLKSVKGLLEIKEDWPASTFELSQTAQDVVIDTGAVSFRVQRDPWKYSLHDSREEPVLQEEVHDVDVVGDCRSLPIGFTTQDGKFRQSDETFYLAPGEHVYGCGESFARLDKVGETIDEWPIDSFGTGSWNQYKCISFLMSTRGYGVFVNSTFRIRGHIGSQSLMAYTLMVDDPRLDLFLIYGPDLKQVLARYVEITGAPAFPPKGSFGIWLSILYWKTDVDSLVALAKKCRELEIPIDLFLLFNLFSNMGKSTDQEELAYAKNVCRALGNMGIKVGMYTAPMLAMGSPMEREARAHKFALKQKNGSPYPALVEGSQPQRFPGKDLRCTLEGVKRGDAWREEVLKATRVPCLLVDFTNPEAVKWWKGKIADRMKAGCYGIAMSDFGEDIPVDAVYYNGHSGLEMHNLYPNLYRKACYEAVAESTAHRGLINARSGIAGMQRFPICWAGDPNCTWQDMVNTLRAGLSIGLSGVPFWSYDNGGFNSTQGNIAPLTPELWTRWSQMSMFISHTRLNGVGPPPRVPWSFGDAAVNNFSKYAKLRYRLLPYIYSHAYNATQTGLPMIRAMVLEFQDDPNTYAIDDQYMFGDAFLVAPVCSPVNRRAVYLPKGTWYEYETGEEFTGPTVLHIEPPLERLPLYVRGDSVIPMGPDMAYVSEKPFNPITLDIRLSSQAEFMLYDDDPDAGTKEIVKCRARKQPGQTALELSSSHKTYTAKFNGTRAPSRVTLNGVDVPHMDSLVALEGAKVGWHFDPSRIVYAKFDALGRENQLALAYTL